MIKKVIKGLKDPRLFFLYIIELGIFKYMPDSLFLRIKYYLKMGKMLDLYSPETFNEKIQWLKLYDRKSSYTSLVDKYEVRRLISQNIGESYLIPLLGVWNKFDDIDFSKLPNQFVLKCTHDSGGIIICKDKSNFDIASAKYKINKLLKKNYYYHCREWPYKYVKPRIICEKYMVDESDKELKDYKFMCFSGEVKCSFVCSNRNFKGKLNVTFFDMNWEIMPFERHYPRSNYEIKRPKNFQKMVELAEKLSHDIPFVRVDFYEVDGKIYFGELTFYPGSGYEEFTPVSYDYLLGSWIKLPLKI